MLLSGRWLSCDDGVLRPIIQGKIRTGTGGWQEAEFLVDSGADRTAFSAAVLGALGLQWTENTSALGGVGGVAKSAIVNTQIQILNDQGVPVVFEGSFAGFVDPDALDMSVLGRDLMARFALIVDRPRLVVYLLGQRHDYRIVEN
jgi:predicted aspartyl protease